MNTARPTSHMTLCPLLQANVVCVVYDVTNEDTVQKVSVATTTRCLIRAAGRTNQ